MESLALLARAVSNLTIEELEEVADGLLAKMPRHTRNLHWVNEYTLATDYNMISFVDVIVGYMKEESPIGGDLRLLTGDQVQRLAKEVYGNLIRGGAGSIPIRKLKRSQIWVALKSATDELAGRKQ